MGWYYVPTWYPLQVEITHPNRALLNSVDKISALTFELVSFSSAVNTKAPGNVWTAQVLFLTNKKTTLKEHLTFAPVILCDLYFNPDAQMRWTMSLQECDFVWYVFQLRHTEYVRCCTPLPGEWSYLRHWSSWRGSAVGAKADSKQAHQMSTPYKSCYCFRASGSVRWK